MLFDWLRYLLSLLPSLWLDKLAWLGFLVAGHVCDLKLTARQSDGDARVHSLLGDFLSLLVFEGDFLG